jgi:hypothetical protein
VAYGIAGHRAVDADDILAKEGPAIEVLGSAIAAAKTSSRRRHACVSAPITRRPAAMLPTIATGIGERSGGQSPLRISRI